MYVGTRKLDVRRRLTVGTGVRMSSMPLGGRRSRGYRVIVRVFRQARRQGFDLSAQEAGTLEETQLLSQHNLMLGRRPHAPFDPD